MTTQQMLDRIKELEEENLKLKQTIAAYETQISTLEESLRNNVNTNASLIENLNKYKHKLEIIKIDIENLKEYQNILENLVAIYESNSHYDNLEENLQISLTDLAFNLLSKSAIILKKNELGEYRPHICSRQYDINEKLISFVRNFDFTKEFPDIMPELEKSTSVSPTSIEIQNCESSEVCKNTDITNMTVAPIITKKGLEYILAILNPLNQIDYSLLSCIAIAYSNTFDRIYQQRLVEELSITDNLTGLYDHTYFTKLTKQLEETQETNIGYVMLDLFRLKYVNDNFGHEAGDTYITTVANIIQKHFNADYVFRLGGDEFSVITVHKSLDYINEKINDINEEIAATEFKTRDGIIFEARIDSGVDYTTGVPVFKELAHNADLQMNANKNNYYMTHGINRRK